MIIRAKERDRGDEVLPFEDVEGPSPRDGNTGDISGQNYMCQIDMCHVKWIRIELLDNPHSFTRGIVEILRD